MDDVAASGPPSPPTPAMPPPPDASLPGVTDGRVDAEVRCVRCGYVVLGLPVDGTCPECGFEVRRSLGARRLTDADPEWIRHVNVGLLLLGGGPIVAVVFMVLRVGLAIVRAATEIDAVLGSGVVDALRVGLTAITFAALAATVAGAFLTTLAEPHETEYEPPSAPRVVARAGLFGAGLLWVIREVAGFMWPTMPEAIESLMLAGVAAGGGAGLCGLMLRFRSLAVRIPAPDLIERATAHERWFRSAAWAGGAAFLFIAIQEAVEVLAPATVVQMVTTVFALFGSCTVLVLLIITFVRLIGLVDLTLRFRAAIRAAVAGEAAHPAGGAAA